MAKPGLINNVKFKHLVYLLKLPAPYVHGHLDYLWRVAYDSERFTFNSIEIELAAEWNGERGMFTKACIESGFLDEIDEDQYEIHDHEDHEPEWYKSRIRKRNYREIKKQEDGVSRDSPGTGTGQSGTTAGQERHKEGQGRERQGKEGQGKEKNEKKTHVAANLEKLTKPQRDFYDKITSKCPSWMRYKPESLVEIIPQWKTQYPNISLGNLIIPFFEWHEANRKGKKTGVLITSFGNWLRKSSKDYDQDNGSKPAVRLEHADNPEHPHYYKQMVVNLTGAEKAAKVDELQFDPSDFYESKFSPPLYNQIDVAKARYKAGFRDR